MLRILILYIIFFCCCNHTVAQNVAAAGDAPKTFIKLERLGNSDVYFEPVCITLESSQEEQYTLIRTKDGWYRIVKTDSVTYDAITHFISNHSDKHFKKSSGGFIDCWTCFGVSVFKDSKQTFYHPIETKEKTTVFLNSLFELLDNRQYDRHLAEFMHEVFDHYRK